MGITSDCALLCPFRFGSHGAFIVVVYPWFPIHVWAGILHCFRCFSCRIGLRWRWLDTPCPKREGGGPCLAGLSWGRAKPAWHTGFQLS